MRWDTSLTTQNWWCCREAIMTPTTFTPNPLNTTHIFLHKKQAFTQGLSFVFNYFDIPICQNWYGLKHGGKLSVLAVGWFLTTLCGMHVSLLHKDIQWYFSDGFQQMIKLIFQSLIQLRNLREPRVKGCQHWEV